jgi:hypothetical protein
MIRVALATASASLLLAAPAVAAERPAEPLPQTADSTNLRVHYTTDPASPHRIDAARAQRLLAAGEAAYATIAGAWGYEILRDGALGGDQRLDIYVAAILPEGYSGRAQPDVAVPRTSGFITIIPARATEPRTIAHELFHLAQYGLDRTEAVWLKEGTAEWAEHRITGDYANGLNVYRPPVSLACADDECGGGYASWRFFEYLTERFGVGIVKRIFEHGRDFGPGAHSQAATDKALEERGSNLGSALAGFAWANLTGAYTRPEVAAWRSPADANLAVPPAGITRTLTIGVDRLASRNVAITAPAAAPCTTSAATLRVVPDAGRTTLPAYQRSGTGPAVPVPADGAPLSWNSCEGLSLLLAVPNTGPAAGVGSYRVQVRVPAPPPDPEPEPEPAPQLVEPGPSGPAPLSSRLRLAGGQRLSTVFRRGLRLKLDAGRTATARVTVTVLADKRTRRRHGLRRTVKSDAVVTGNRTVSLRLRRSRSARRLPSRLRLTVRVRIAAADGAVRVHTSTITLTRRSARSR